jgi:hypothetical protein
MLGLLELSFVVRLFMDGGKFFGAFNLVLELIFCQAGVFASFGGSTNQPVLVGGLLTLDLRRLENGTRKWVNLRHLDPVSRRSNPILSAKTARKFSQNRLGHIKKMKSA